jgi:Asp/Glu/hydantoin racemase
LADLAAEALVVVRGSGGVQNDTAASRLGVRVLVPVIDGALITTQHCLGTVIVQHQTHCQGQ